MEQEKYLREWVREVDGGSPEEGHSEPEVDDGIMIFMGRRHGVERNRGRGVGVGSVGSEAGRDVAGGRESWRRSGGGREGSGRKKRASGEDGLGGFHRNDGVVGRK